jgi:hypothetical protein
MSAEGDAADPAGDVFCRGRSGQKQAQAKDDEEKPDEKTSLRHGTLF